MQTEKISECKPPLRCCNFCKWAKPRHERVSSISGKVFYTDVDWSDSVSCNYAGDKVRLGLINEKYFLSCCQEFEYKPLQNVLGIANDYELVNCYQRCIQAELKLDRTSINNLAAVTNFSNF